MAPARAAGPGHERHHEINPAYVIAHDDLWETLLASYLRGARFIEEARRRP